MKKLFAVIPAVILISMQMFSSVVTADENIKEIGLYDDWYMSTENFNSGNPFFFHYEIKNNLNTDISNIMLEVMPGSSYVLMDGDNPDADSKREIAGTIAANDSSGELAIKLRSKGSGNALSLRFSCTDAASADHIVDHIIFLAGSDGSSDDTPSSGRTITTADYKPKLSAVGDTDIPVGRAGEVLRFSLPVKNTSGFGAKDVIVRLEAGDAGKFPFEPDKMNFSRTVKEIAPNTVVKVPFDLMVAPGAAEGIYGIKVSYDFGNAYNTRFDSAETIYVKVVNSGIPIKLVVDQVETDPGGAVPGENMKLSLRIRNIGNMKARDIRLSLLDLNSGGFTVQGAGSVKYLNSLNGKTNAIFVYNLHAAPGIIPGNQKMGVRLEYKDESGSSYTEDNSIFIPVEGGGKPVVVLEDLKAPAGEIGVNQDFKMGFTLVNTGTVKAYNVKVTVAGDKDVVNKTLNTVMVGDLDRDQAEKLEFIMGTTKDAASGSHPVSINVEYDEVQGDDSKRHTVTQYAGVLVGGSIGKTVPKLIVDKYSFARGEVNAGQQFDLNVSFLNTSGAVPVSNIKITFQSEDGTFTPAGSSNTFYIEGIGIKESVERSIALYPKADVEPKSYSLSVNFEYEDGTGAQYTSKEIITIPVRQKPRFVTGEISTMPDAFVGQPAPVSLEFYNMGKSTLYNLMVSVDGDFAGQNANYFVGNFEPGRSDFYDGTVTPSAEGQVKGYVVFTFEDAAGNPSEIRKEFTLNVMPMQQPAHVSPEGMQNLKEGRGIPGAAAVQGGFKVFSPLTLGAAGLVAVIAAVVFVILRRKARARKEMSLDD